MRKLLLKEVMIIIVVIILLSLIMFGIFILYGISNGYRGAHEAHSIGIESGDWNASTGKLVINVKNLGYQNVSVNAVYVNAKLDDAAISNPIFLDVNQRINITLSGTFWDTHTDIPIKVTTLEGASNERSLPIYEIWIQSINWNHQTGKIDAIVWTKGYETRINISEVYVNEILTNATTNIVEGDPVVYEVTLSKIYANNPASITLKIVTSDGAFDESTRHPNEY